MTLPSAPNAISLSQVNTELGASSTASRNMDSGELRLLFLGTNTSGAQISMSSGWGKGMYYEFRLYGASGGLNYGNFRAGDGGRTFWSGYMAAGTVITYYVGGKGTNGQGQTRAAGAGGGGTAVLIGTTLIAMAGAGGGSGSWNNGTYNGITFAGAPGGGTSGLGGPGAPFLGHGGGGTQTTGGTIYGGRLNGVVGTGPATGTGKTGGDATASNGQWPYAGGWGYGTGGRSGNSTNSGGDSGAGGGGGGYYGGGGGSDLSGGSVPDGTGGGGGGGSGYVRTTSLPAGVTYISSSTTAQAGVNNGNGYIEVWRLGVLYTTLTYTGASATYTLP